MKKVVFILMLVVFSSLVFGDENGCTVGDVNVGNDGASYIINNIDVVDNSEVILKRGSRLRLFLQKGRLSFAVSIR